MNHINVFLNTKVVNTNSPSANIPVAFGNWCLTPVRYLFDGNTVTISAKDTSYTVNHEKKERPSNPSYMDSVKNFLKVVASIILIIPGIIIGAIFKGLGYLSRSIRADHTSAIWHYTPRDITIGRPETRVSLSEIDTTLDSIKEHNWMNPPAKNLVIYAKKGTKINTAPKIIDLNPQKIILDGARIVHEPQLGRLDDGLVDLGYQNSTLRSEDQTFVHQYAVGSVEEALSDIPPKVSLFSSKRYGRVYNIS